MKRSMLLFNLLLAALLLLSSCKQPAAPTTPSGGETPAVTEEKPQEGGTLTIHVDSMNQFDYARCADDVSFYVISNVYSTLYRCDTFSSIFPDLATSWEYEDDTTLILHLREGVMFQDGNEVFAEGEGREVVADDVVYSIKRGVEMEGSTISGDFLAIYESVEAVDKYTVKLKLTAPNALLMICGRGLGGFAIVPHEAVEKLGEDFALKPVGSGPFEFVEYLPDEHVVLQRNEDYWKKPLLDKVVFKIVPDQSAALIAFEAGELDSLGAVPEADVERLRANDAYKLYTSGLQGAPWIMFDMKVPEFQELKFRQALAYSFDGEAISRNIEKSNYTGGCGISGKGIPGYDETLCDLFPYDVEKAQALLAELGWKDSDGDGVLDKDGKPMKVVIEIWNTDPMPKYGEAIVSQMRAAGIGVELQTVEFGTWIEDLFKEGGPGKAMMASGFNTDGGLNGVFGRESATAKSMSYDMEDVYNMLDQANVTLDPAARDKLLRDAQRQLFSQYLAIPLRHSGGFGATRSHVQDWQTPAWTANFCTEKNNVWLKP